MGKRQDDMTRGIDRLARAFPYGQLAAAMGPLQFLSQAADHIDAVTAERDRLRALVIHLITAWDSRSVPGYTVAEDVLEEARRVTRKGTAS